jgi:hypothetical protein
MSLTKPSGRTIDGLSLRGFAWSVGSAFLTVEAGASLIVTLIVAVVAYVKGS